MTCVVVVVGVAVVGAADYGSAGERIGRKQ